MATRPSYDRELAAALDDAAAVYQRESQKTMPQSYLNAFAEEWLIADPQRTYRASFDRIWAFARRMRARGYTTWALTPAEVGAFIRELVKPRQAVLVTPENPAPSQRITAATFADETMTLRRMAKLSERPQLAPATVPLAHPEQWLRDKVSAALDEGEVAFQAASDGVSYAQRYRRDFHRVWRLVDVACTGEIHHVGQAATIARALESAGWTDWAGWESRELPLWTALLRHAGHISVRDFAVSSESGEVPGVPGFVPPQPLGRVARAPRPNPTIERRPSSRQSCVPPGGDSIEDSRDVVPVVASSDSRGTSSSAAVGVPESRACLVCLTNERTVACMPCRHVTLCGACASVERLDRRQCFVCRADVAELLALFM